MLELGEQLLEVGTVANEQAVLITESAREVAVRGAELVATLPTLERAVALATPLEGTVERLGRIVLAARWAEKGSTLGAVRFVDPGPCGLPTSD